MRSCANADLVRQRLGILLACDTLTDLRDRKLLVDSGRAPVPFANRSHGISAAPSPATASYEAI